MGIFLDVAVCAFFVLAFALGLYRGLVKQTSRLLIWLVSFAGSILLAALITIGLQGTGMFYSLAEKTSAWYADDPMTTVIYSADDLAELIGSHRTLNSLAHLAEPIYEKMVNLSTEEFTCDTLGLLFGHYTASIIIGFISWLLLYILLVFMLQGIVYLFKKVITLPILHPLDKLLGGVWAVGIAYLVIIGLVLSGAEIAIIMFAPETWNTIAEMIQDTTVLVWLHDNNFIGTLLANSLSVEIPKLKDYAENALLLIGHFA